jgi:hypothetical protein
MWRCARGPEPRHLNEPVPPIEGNRRPLLVACLEPQEVGAGIVGVNDQGGDQGVGDASTAVLGRDEEPLQLADAALLQLDAPSRHSEKAAHCVVHGPDANRPHRSEPRHSGAGGEDPPAEDRVWLAGAVGRR